MGGWAGLFFESGDPGGWVVSPPPATGGRVVGAVNGAMLDCARFPRLFHFAGEAIFFNFNFFLIFFATPDRAQREQPIGGLGLCVRARVRSVWRVEV